MPPLKMDLQLLWWEAALPTWTISKTETDAGNLDVGTVKPGGITQHSQVKNGRRYTAGPLRPFSDGPVGMPLSHCRPEGPMQPMYIQVTDLGQWHPNWAVRKGAKWAGGVSASGLDL
ncbi:hypothetical protein PSTG_11207 [Puccinia striiformis f. sp. tritici PST-78]|uniref:Uncharacterized protein n=1 Tax=Puccinia striiformis f. sp. tritici PST-78 TaxID=1165861 RepID=A0A0L0V891_9BASI|nr:hypothetical protein PSTG_11207 [Puccinia striiformis f. sp. tritici PST-78]